MMIELTPMDTEWGEDQVKWYKPSQQPHLFDISKCVIRPVSLYMDSSGKKGQYTHILYDDAGNWYVSEPYEEVKRRIMAAQGGGVNELDRANNRLIIDLEDRVMQAESDIVECVNEEGGIRKLLFKLESDLDQCQRRLAELEAEEVGK